MENQKIIKKTAAGIFFVLGIVLIGFSVFFIGLDRGLTEQKFEVFALFKEVGGLRTGAPIRISGINVGVVKAVDFLDEPISNRSLKVTLNIFKKYEFQFRKCSRISIRTEGVLGQKLVEISENHEYPVFKLNEPIIGEDPLDVEDMAGVITKTALSLQKSSQGINVLMSDMQTATRKAQRLMNRFEEKLMEGNLFKIF